MDKNQTIWFVTNIHSSSNGGVARSVSTLSTYLKNSGYKVNLIFSKNKNTNFLSFSIYAFIKYLKSLYKNKPHWIIARSTDSFFTLLFIKVFKINTRVIIYNHGWEPLISDLEKRIPKHIIDNPTTFKAKLIRFPMLKISLMLCDYLISGTIFETRYLKRKFQKYSSKFKYLPNALVFKNANRNIIKAEETFLTVANMNWKKNLSYTINLFNSIRKEHPKVKLICAGTSLSDNEFYKEFGDSDNIKNIPSVNPEEINALYKESKYLISSSRYEGGHSFAILEGMIHGNIIFATPVPSTKEIINNGQNGILISGTDITQDTKTINEAILAEKSQMVKKAYNSIRKFSIRRVGPQLERLLNS